MKVGIGLYRHMLTKANYRFARQMGCTHVVIHLVDYHGRPKPANTASGSTGGAAAGAGGEIRTDSIGHPRSRYDNQPVGSADSGWGVAGESERLWTTDELLEIRKEIECEGLTLEAIENFDPAFWYDVLLDGPQKDAQLEGLKRLIQSIGRAGIPVMGYNFSIAGVASRITGPFARGGAESVGVHGIDQTPLPLGMVWNMVYDQTAKAGVLPPVTEEELWERLEYFLKSMLPIAEEAGVKMAAHPDDPPAATVRSTPRLVHRPELYQRLIDIDPSPSNTLEYCIGTIAEMPDGDVYEATDRFSAQGRIGYVHCRNVRGKMPDYEETFIDEGDVDMIRVLRILQRNEYQGVIIPDHTPLPMCGAPWHAGMAFAIGYLHAAMASLSLQG